MPPNDHNPNRLLPYIELLCACLASPTGGTRVPTTNPVRLKALLYEAQRTDPDAYREIAINTSRTDPQNEIWLTLTSRKAEHAARRHAEFLAKVNPDDVNF